MHMFTEVKRPGSEANVHVEPKSRKYGFKIEICHTYLQFLFILNDLVIYNYLLCSMLP